MANKAKQYQAMTMLAVLIMTANAGYCMDAMESKRAGIAQFETGMDVKELINRQSQEIALPQPEPQKASDQAEGMYGFLGKSAFAGLDECGIVNAQFVRQPSLKEAVHMLRPCMQAVTKKYGVTVSAGESLISGPSKPMLPVSRVRVGIGIIVSGKIPPGNTALVDLYYTIETLHNNSLLCHPAKVEYLGEITPFSDSVKSGSTSAGHQAVRQRIKEELESAYPGVNAYFVVTGVQIEPEPADAAVNFKAHKKLVGHGWEERYAVTGTYNVVTRKVVDYKSTKIYGDMPRHIIH